MEQPREQVEDGRRGEARRSGARSYPLSRPYDDIIRQSDGELVRDYEPKILDRCLCRSCWALVTVVSDASA